MNTPLDNLIKKNLSLSIYHKYSKEFKSLLSSSPINKYQVKAMLSQIPFLKERLLEQRQFILICYSSQLMEKTHIILLDFIYKDIQDLLKKFSILEKYNKSSGT